MNKAQPSPSSKRRFLWAGGIVLALGAALILATPIIVSTSWGKEQLVSTLNGRINGTVDYSSLQLSWLGGQEITGLTVHDNNGKQVVHLAHAKTDASLFSILFKRLPGETVVEDLDVEIIPYVDGTTNIDYLLKKVTVPSTAQQLPTIHLQDVAAQGEGAPLPSLHLTGKTLVDSKEGSFNINVVSLADKDIKIDAVIQQFPVLILDQVMAVKNPSLRGTLPALLGDTLNINISQTIDKNRSDTNTLLYNVLLKIVGEKSHISLESTQDQNPHVDFKFNVEGIQATPLLLQISDKVHLKEPSTIKIDLSSEPIRRLFDQAIPLQWKAASPATITINQFDGAYPLRDLTTATLDAALQLQNVIFYNLPTIGDIEILRADLTTVSMDAKRMRFKLQAKVRALNARDSLSSLGAEPFDIITEGIASVSKEGQVVIDDLRLNAQNALLALSFKGKLTADQQLVMTSPAQVTWKKDATDLVLRVEPLQLSLKDPKITTLKAAISMQAHDGDLLDLEWNAHTRTLLAAGSFDAFPIGRISPELEAVFGAALSGSVNISIKNGESGPVRLSLKGENGSVSIDGRYDKGYLFLNAPLEGQVKASPQLAKVVLHKVMPLLGGLLSSDKPITFKIDAENFSLPLFPLKPEQMTIGLATVDFGTLQLRNVGSLAKVLSILRPGKESSVAVQFTPLYLHYNKGGLNIERVDALLQNRYPIAAWGNVDLSNKLIDMQIGLSGTTIAHAFNVQIGNPDMYIAIPLKGNLQDPVLDKTSATAQITSLVAQNQAGTPGKIIGTVLQIASTGSVVPGANIPPPTTSPLPWEGKLPAPEADGSLSNPVTKPVKNITENAGKLLKNLFR